MAAPTLTVSTNKSSYAPGEDIIVTVVTSDADRQTLTLTTTVTDSSGATGTATSVVAIDAGSVTISSSPARTWTKLSDDGTTVVFKAVA